MTSRQLHALVIRAKERRARKEKQELELKREELRFMAQIHGARLINEAGQDPQQPELPEEHHEKLERLAAEAGARKQAEYRERMKAARG